MARTTRKVNHVQPRPSLETPSDLPRVYRTGGYVRLSVEDSGKPGADTLEAQRELVRGFIVSQTDMTFCGIYCDNGRTGTNFERPAFQRLMDDVRGGKIDCIVVKDLSRFGRNYLEAGNYLERIFPFLDVRFVAVNDHFDTRTAERDNNGLIMPLKNIINAAYSKDISQKSSSALTTKRKNGEFIGSWAPYGYQKSAADHHKLEPNQETAPIVKMIFAWRREGVSYLQIARRLNRLGIPSPSRYHYLKGEVKKERFATAQWHVPVIKRILRNRVYLGHMVQGRDSSGFPMNKKLIRLPESEWIVVPDTHEPLIDEETFRIVQEMDEMCRAVHQERRGCFDHLGRIPNILQGLVFCADCKRPMIRYKNVSPSCEHLYYSYICLTHAEDPTACPKKYLPETKLLEIVWDALRHEIALAGDLETRIDEYHHSQETVRREDALQRELAAAKKALDRSTMLRDSLYQNYVDRLMSEREYMELRERYRADMEQARARIASLEQRQQTERRKVSENPWLLGCRRFREEPALTEEMAHALVERIEIDAESHVSITLRYEDACQALIQLLRKDGEAPPA